MSGASCSLVQLGNRHPDDPTPEPHEFRIYGDDLAQTWAIVDEIDYHWAIQWLWSIKWSRGGRKCYLRRNQQIGTKREGRIQQTIWLHVEIHKRTGIKPPSSAHHIVDHRDGDSFNCRRSNFRWATHSMNSLNRFGKLPYDLEELM